MLMRRLEESNCPYCGDSVLCGVKEEPSIWKVYFQCNRDGCSREYFGGRIPREDIGHIDEVYERAEQMLAGL